MDVTTLILKSDILIKGVMLFLLGFSVISWAIFFSKFSFLKKTQKESELFYQKFKQSKDMDHLISDADRHSDGYLSVLYSAGYAEMEACSHLGMEKESLENVQRAMIAKRDNIVDALGMKISFLATIGSSSPFI